MTRTVNSGRRWLGSTALHSDLIAAGSETVVRGSTHWICLQSPRLPTWRLGNALLLRRPPTASSATETIARVKRLMTPETAAVARIAWSPGIPSREAYSVFEQSGYERYDSLSMVATRLAGRSLADGSGVLMLASERDWLQLLEFHLRIYPPRTSAEQEFLERRVELWRRRAADGTGAVFAIINDGVAGVCGVFLGEGTGRLLSLDVLPENRRTGIGHVLAHSAGRWALSQRGVRRLVAVVDPTYHARALFASLGFAPRDLARGIVPSSSFRPTH